MTEHLGDLLAKQLETTTAAEIARHVGVSGQAISTWAEKAHLPSKVRYRALAEVLGVTASEVADAVQAQKADLKVRVMAQEPTPAVDGAEWAEVKARVLGAEWERLRMVANDWMPNAAIEAWLERSAARMDHASELVQQMATRLDALERRLPAAERSSNRGAR